MPELPEVEALARELDERLRGRRIQRLAVTEVAALKTFDPAPEALAGQTIQSVERVGKMLVIRTDTLALVVHLARSGWVRWRNESPRPTAGRGRGPLAARLMLDDGSGFDLTEQATQKRLAIHIVRDPQQVGDLATLGPDPLAPEFTEERLAEILTTAGKAQLKGLLRDQRTIAGIGNAYSDEILHVAKLSPFHPATLTEDERHTLYAAIQSTLRDAIARTEGVSMTSLKSEKRSNLRVHGRTGEPCPECGDTIRQVIYADSTMQYCATCQTKGKPLADRVLSRLGVRR